MLRVVGVKPHRGGRRQILRTGGGALPGHPWWRWIAPGRLAAYRWDRGAPGDLYAGRRRSTRRGRLVCLTRPSPTLPAWARVSRWKIAACILEASCRCSLAMAASRAFISAMDRSISARCSAHCGWWAPQRGQRTAGLISRPHEEH